MNMDEHLEEIEEDFGSELSKSASTTSDNKQNQTSARMPWLNANGIIVPKINHRKSRWGAEVTPTARADNIISSVTEKYYGKEIPNAVSALQQPPMMPPSGLVMTSYGYVPAPMFMPPFMVPPMRVSTSQTKEKSPKIRSSRSRSRSPRYRSPRSPRYSRSPDIANGISTSHVSSEEKRMMEENKIFVKLLLTKLMAIKNNQRLESLHVSLMSTVKKALDDEMLEQRQSKR